MQLHIFQTDAVEEVHSDRVIVNCGYISTAIYVAACVFVFKCVVFECIGMRCARRDIVSFKINQM